MQCHIGNLRLYEVVLLMGFPASTQFHVMAKPIGPLCNLDCTYCYYLSKADLLEHRGGYQIAESVLDEFIRQRIDMADNSEEVVFSWQGGEPTLLGVDFFRKIVDLQKRCRRQGQRINNDIQTNGTLLDDQWCCFLAENDFLVGLSVDGPQPLHDHYRKGKNGESTFEKVFEAANLLRKNNVEFNTLTVVNNLNSRRPLEVYNFLRDELGSRYLQFIPAVEPVGFAITAPQHWDAVDMVSVDSPLARPSVTGSVVTDWSVDPDDYGEFLCAIFDQWLNNDVGEVFVPLFEAAIGMSMGRPSSACYFAEICGKCMALEHDGSLYSCDHYVYPEYRLGNIQDLSLMDMLYSEKQINFGLAKIDNLPTYCRKCEFISVCNGECPKNRFLLTPDGEPGLNYLCSGLRRYFRHIEPWIRKIARELNAGRSAAGVMKRKRRQPIGVADRLKKPLVKLNAPCPCGSGRKYKKCCMNSV